MKGEELVPRQDGRLGPTGLLAAKAGRARAAADIARVGPSAVSLIGRVLTTAPVIVGVQWLVIIHSFNQTLRWVVLGLPALQAFLQPHQALLSSTDSHPGPLPIMLGDPKVAPEQERASTQARSLPSSRTIAGYTLLPTIRFAAREG